jgi:hypothetical protein
MCTSSAAAEKVPKRQGGEEVMSWLSATASTPAVTSAISDHRDH